MNESERSQNRKLLVLERTHFDSDGIEHLSTGAGIILMSVDPNGNFQILLGRERYVNQWKGAADGLDSRDLRKDGESIMVTAMREFNEESMGTVVHMEDLEDALKQKNYYIRIVLKISNFRKPERYHVTYVVFVEWNENLPHRFQNVRSHLEYVESLCQEWNHVRPSFLGERGNEIGPVRQNEDGSYVFEERV